MRVYLLPSGASEDKSREDGKGMLGISRPALYDGSQGHAKHGHRVR